MNRLSALTNKYGFILHPLLFAIFPLLSFYGANVAEIRSGDFRLTAFVVFNMIAGAAAWTVALLLTRSIQKSSLLAVVFIAVFFTFGRVHNAMHDVAFETPVTIFGPTKILVLTSLALACVSWFVVSKISKESAVKANSILLLVSAVLIISSLATILTSQGSNNLRNAASEQTKLTTTNNANQEKPDIYYIVLDSYARGDFLEEKFGFNNEEFLNALRDKGFYVADKANSNYAYTFLSLPSTFNMKYVNYLTEQVGETSTDRQPLKDMLLNNEAVPIFKSLGYKFVNIGSQWKWTETSPLADIKINTEAKTDSKILSIELDEFAQVYLQTTAIKPWISSELKDSLVAKTLGAFEKTKEVSKITEPTFTLTHVLSPHPPYLFDENGIIKGLTKLELDNHGFSDREKFKSQTIYINKLVTELVDDIIQNSDKPPIIVVASDHGPASSLSEADLEQQDLTKLSVEGIRERMGILNAYYFPDKKYDKLYPNITPVNSLRLILNQYFGQDIELLSDKSYFSSHHVSEYLFHDVTDLVK